MRTKLKAVNEKSTKMIIVSFLDETETAEDIKTMKWTLTDTAGNVINEREDIVVVDPGPVETIVLSGNDLAIIGGGGNEERLFTVEATYDSIFGNDFPLNNEASFTVIDLTAIEDGTP